MPGPDRNSPRPPPDIVVDRTPEQRTKDALHSQEQVGLLMRGIAADNREDELVGILWERRAEADDSVVRFEVAVSRSGQPTLVVPRQLLLRVGAGAQDAASPIKILQDAGFVEGGIADQPSGCEELQGRLRSFTGPPGANAAAVVDTVDKLTAAGFSSAPTAVEALHQRPRPSSIVVKSATGPAPTGVVFDEARIHDPAGEIVVAVIDTGIVRKQRRDSWLKDVRRTPENVDPLDVFGGQPGGNGKLDFAAGHGTFAAGIVRQIDAEAEIRCYAALDSDGLASEMGVACAMIRAVRDGAHVVNLSLGMRTFDNQPCLAIETALDLIDEMTEGSEPPVFVASAGNYGDSEPVWPAASRRVVSVAGLTAKLEPAGWSSRGVWVDCSTVAEGVVSTYVEGDEDPVFGGNDHYALVPDTDAWAVWAGTSFAAPQIAGEIARTCRTSNLPPREAARQVLRSGTMIPDYGRALLLLPGT